MLIPVVSEFTQPMNYSMIFGGPPAAGMSLGAETNFAMGRSYVQIQRYAIDLSMREQDSPDKGRKIPRSARNDN
jgi:hypothetical protein